MNAFSCVRCGSDRQQASPPMPGPAGIRAYEQICAACWQEWLQQQTALINHYGLNLRDAQARKFLSEQSEQFLFAAPKDQSA